MATSTRSYTKRWANMIHSFLLRPTDSRIESLLLGRHAALTCRTRCLTLSRRTFPLRCDTRLNMVKRKT